MSNERITQMIQGLLALLILVGFFLTLWLFILHAATMSPDVKQIVSDLVSSLVIILSTAMGYFFARHRSGETGVPPTVPADPAKQVETK